MAETVPRRTATLVSFDGTEQCEVAFHEPGSREALTAALRDHQRVAIRGSGLSYCQAGAADGSPSISTKAFDRVLDLDHGASTITVEAGCTIGALVRHAVDHGFWFPVLPGHPEITVGGCAAFNTHGKTQHDIGNFSDHIVSLTLLHPDHGETTCGPNERPDLFELTVGGMGLTGWIVDLTLRLQPLTGRSIRRRAHPSADLHRKADRVRRLTVRRVRERDSMPMQPPCTDRSLIRMRVTRVASGNPPGNVRV